MTVEQVVTYIVVPVIGLAAAAIKLAQSVAKRRSSEPPPAPPPRREEPSGSWQVPHNPPGPGAADRSGAWGALPDPRSVLAPIEALEKAVQSQIAPLSTAINGELRLVNAKLDALAEDVADLKRAESKRDERLRTVEGQVIDLRARDRGRKPTPP